MLYVVAYTHILYLLTKCGMTQLKLAKHTHTHTHTQSVVREKGKGDDSVFQFGLLTQSLSVSNQ